MSTTQRTEKPHRPQTIISTVDAVNSARIQELFEKALKHSYLDQNYKNEYWKMDEITVITNETLEKRFRTKKNLLKLLNGRVYSLNLFSCYRGNHYLNNIAQEGIRIKAPFSNFHILGDNAKGVILGQHVDLQLRAAEMKQESVCWVVVFAGVCSRIAQINCTIDGKNNLPPTVGCDCHISKARPSLKQILLDQAVQSQIYLYDIEDDGGYSCHPRQCLPLAYVVFRESKSCSGSSVVVRHMEIKSSLKKDTEEFVDLTTADDDAYADADDGPAQSAKKAKENSELYTKLLDYVENTLSADEVYRMSFDPSPQPLTRIGSTETFSTFRKEPSVISCTNESDSIAVGGQNTACSLLLNSLKNISMIQPQNVGEVNKSNSIQKSVALPGDGHQTRQLLAQISQFCVPRNQIRLRSPNVSAAVQGQRLSRALTPIQPASSLFPRSSVNLFHPPGSSRISNSCNTITSNAMTFSAASTGMLQMSPATRGMPVISIHDMHTSSVNALCSTASVHLSVPVVESTQKSVFNQQRIICVRPNSCQTQPVSIIICNPIFKSPGIIQPSLNAGAGCIPYAGDVFLQPTVSFPLVNNSLGQTGLSSSNNISSFDEGSIDNFMINNDELSLHDVEPIVIMPDGLHDECDEVAENNVSIKDGIQGEYGNPSSQKVEENVSEQYTGKHTIILDADFENEDHFAQLNKSNHEVITLHDGTIGEGDNDVLEGNLHISDVVSLSGIPLLQDDDCFSIEEPVSCDSVQNSQNAVFQLNSEVFQNNLIPGISGSTVLENSNLNVENTEEDVIVGTSVLQHDSGSSSYTGSLNKDVEPLLSHTASLTLLINKSDKDVRTCHRTSQDAFQTQENMPAVTPGSMGIEQEKEASTEYREIPILRRATRKRHRNSSKQSKSKRFKNMPSDLNTLLLRDTQGLAENVDFLESTPEGSNITKNNSNRTNTIPVFKICEDGSIEVRLDYLSENDNETEASDKSEVASCNLRLELTNEIPNQDEIVKSLTGKLGKIQIIYLEGSPKDIASIQNRKSDVTCNMSADSDVGSALNEGERLKDKQTISQTVGDENVTFNEMVMDSEDADFIIESTCSIDPDKFNEINETAVWEVTNKKQLLDNSLNNNNSNSKQIETIISAVKSPQAQCNTDENMDTTMCIETELEVSYNEVESDIFEINEQSSDLNGKLMMPSGSGSVISPCDKLSIPSALAPQTAPLTIKQGLNLVEIYDLHECMTNDLNRESTTCIKNGSDTSGNLNINTAPISQSEHCNTVDLNVRKSSSSISSLEDLSSTLCVTSESKGSSEVKSLASSHKAGCLRNDETLVTLTNMSDYGHGQESCSEFEMQNPRTFLNLESSIGSKSSLECELLLTSSPKCLESVDVMNNGAMTNQSEISEVNNEQPLSLAMETSTVDNQNLVLADSGYSGSLAAADSRLKSDLPSFMTQALPPFAEHILASPNPITESDLSYVTEPISPACFTEPISHACVASPAYFTEPISPGNVETVFLALENVLMTSPYRPVTETVTPITSPAKSCSYEVDSVPLIANASTQVSSASKLCQDESTSRRSQNESEMLSSGGNIDHDQGQILEANHNTDIFSDHIAPDSFDIYRMVNTACADNIRDIGQPERDSDDFQVLNLNKCTELNESQEFQNAQNNYSEPLACETVATYTSMTIDDSLLETDPQVSRRAAVTSVKKVKAISLEEYKRTKIMRSKATPNNTEVELECPKINKPSLSQNLVSDQNESCHKQNNTDFRDLESINLMRGSSGNQFQSSITDAAILSQRDPRLQRRLQIDLHDSLETEKINENFTLNVIQSALTEAVHDSRCIEIEEDNGSAAEVQMNERRLDDEWLDKNVENEKLSEIMASMEIDETGFTGTGLDTEEIISNGISIEEKTHFTQVHNLAVETVSDKVVSSLDENIWIGTSELITSPNEVISSKSMHKKQISEKIVDCLDDWEVVGNLTVGIDETELNEDKESGELTSDSDEFGEFVIKGDRYENKNLNAVMEEDQEHVWRLLEKALASNNCHKAQIGKSKYNKFKKFDTLTACSDAQGKSFVGGLNKEWGETDDEQLKKIRTLHDKRNAEKISEEDSKPKSHHRCHRSKKSKHKSKSRGCHCSNGCPSSSSHDCGSKCKMNSKKSNSNDRNWTREDDELVKVARNDDDFHIPTSVFGNADSFVLFLINAVKMLPLELQEHYSNAVEMILLENKDFIKNEHVYDTTTDILTEEDRQHIVRTNSSPLMAKEIQLNGILEKVMLGFEEIGSGSENDKKTQLQRDILILTREMLYDQMNELKCYQKSLSVYVVPEDLRLTRESGKYISVEGAHLFLSKSTLSVDMCTRLHSFKAEIEEMEEVLKDIPLDAEELIQDISRKLGVLHWKRKQFLSSINCTLAQLQQLMETFATDVCWFRNMGTILQLSNESPDDQTIKFVNDRIKKLEEFSKVAESLTKTNGIWIIKDKNVL